jgi:hypothetical protein
LGTGDTSQRNYPELINVESLPVIKISAGNLFSLVIASNFTCYGKKSTNASICSGNGICIQKDVCSCGYEFSGKECQFTTCFGKNSSDSSVCGGNGKCISKDYCTCTSPYGGNECEINYSLNTQSIAYSCGLNDVIC